MSEMPPHPSEVENETPAASGGSPLDPPATPGESAPQEQRTMGMLCHLLALSGVIGIPFANIIGPLIIWLIKKDEMPFVDDQGKESLNFQISLTIVGIALGVISIIPFVGCITFPILLGIIIAAIVFVIIATIKANAGEYYRYPLSLRLIK